MSRVNRTTIGEPTTCSPTPVIRSLEETTPCCCDSPTSPGNNANSNGSGSTNGNTSGNIRRVPNVFSQIERLESFESDLNMLRPLLMYNIENIQQLRAD